jgi:hypothetical protein
VVKGFFVISHLSLLSFVKNYYEDS